MLLGVADELARVNGQRNGTMFGKKGSIIPSRGDQEKADVAMRMLKGVHRGKLEWDKTN